MSGKLSKEEIAQLSDYDYFQLSEEEQLDGSKLYPFDVDDQLSIELDCAPMTPRPSQYFSASIKDTELKRECFVCTGRAFGMWTFSIKNEFAQLFRVSKPQLKKNIEELYNAGKIRYGSW
jgi:putative aminopeptidase FrvX